MCVGHKSASVYVLPRLLFSILPPGPPLARCHLSANTEDRASVYIVRIQRKYNIRLLSLAYSE